jgi:hypothetical protein
MFAEAYLGRDQVLTQFETELMSLVDGSSRYSLT